jgi:putative sterol carrier protein
MFMADPTIADFMTRMSEAFIPEKATGIDAIIQLKLTGAQAAAYYVTIKDAKCTLSPGEAPTAKLTLSADADNFVKIFTGQMDGMQAFMQGKLKLSGDMSLAMKLMSLFKMA